MNYIYQTYIYIYIYALYKYVCEWLGNTSKEQYETRYDNNCLKLIWKIDRNDKGTFYPIMPVLVTNRDIELNDSNKKHAMELGLGYGYDYWLNFTNNIKRGV